MKFFGIQFFIRLILPLAVIALIGGCNVLPEPTADPTRHFVLTGPGATNATVAKPASAFQIGVRPIELPGYLRNHRDMAVRNGLNEIRFQEFARWAEPLEAGISRVLRERLLATEPVGGVLVSPFPAEVRRDYDVLVRIVHCEGATGGDQPARVRFEAAYDVVASGATGDVVVRRTFSAPDLVWDGTDFSALARLLSDSVQKLADDIAANLPK